MVDSSINNVEPHLPIDYKMKNNNNQVENNSPVTTDILPPTYKEVEDEKETAVTIKELSIKEQGNHDDNNKNDIENTVSNVKEVENKPAVYLTDTLEVITF